MPLLIETDLPNLCYRGKVRDLYLLGDEFLIVACYQRDSESLFVISKQKGNNIALCSIVGGMRSLIGEALSQDRRQLLLGGHPS